MSFLDTTALVETGDSVLDKALFKFSQQFDATKEIADKLIGPLTEVRKKANLDDLWDSLVYSLTSLAVEGVFPFNIKLPDNLDKVILELWKAVKKTGSLAWNAFTSVNWDTVILLIAIGAPIVEKFGIKLFKDKIPDKPTENMKLRLDFLEQQLGIDADEHKKWTKSVTEQRIKNSEVKGFYGKLGKKVGGVVGSSIARFGPWYVAYRVSKLLVDAFEGSVYYLAHKIKGPAEDVLGSEKGTFIGSHKEDPSVTAWEGADGTVRFYDKNDQEYNVYTPNPFNMINVENPDYTPSDKNKKFYSGSSKVGFLDEEPEMKNTGGLIANYNRATYKRNGGLIVY